MPDHADGLVVTNAGALWNGRIPADSPAVGAGVPALYSSNDLDGNLRPIPPSIGAYEPWTPPTAHDTDDDGLSDADEMSMFGTDPYLADSDNDGVGDGAECLNGTDPTDPHSFMQTLSVAVTNKVSLSFPVRVAWGSSATGWETNGLAEFPDGFGCVTYTNTSFHGATHVKAYCDMDGDGEWSGGETGMTIPLPIQRHDNNVTNRLSFGAFDQDRDDIPDIWETAHGLCPTNAADAYDDPDGDGLINVHEYVFGYDPNLSDATNTALACFTRSVDSRIAGKIPSTALCKFNNYTNNGIDLRFDANTNFWAKDVDTSCASMWNVQDDEMSCLMAGTAISSRHVIFVFHFTPSIGATLYFMDNDGNVYSNTLIKTVGLSVTPANDVRIGLLASQLPTNIVPAKILPSDYYRYIGTGKKLPSVRFDQEEKLIVSELNALSKVVKKNGDVSCVQSPSMLRSAFFEPVVSGDSGNPRFLIMGDSVVLLCTMWTTGGNGAGAGCLLTNLKDQIQDAMNNLAIGFQLQEFDLTSFDELPQKGIGDYDYD